MLMKLNSLQSSTLRLGQKLKVRAAEFARRAALVRNPRQTLMIVADLSGGRGNVQHCRSCPVSN